MGSKVAKKIYSGANQYLKVKADRIEFLGERYFQFNWESEKVVQVCFSIGDIKRGKSHTFGIYLITKMSFVSNYFAMNYVEPCTKAEYKKQFDKVLQMLQPTSTK